MAAKRQIPFPIVLLGIFLGVLLPVLICLTPPVAFTQTQDTVTPPAPETQTSQAPFPHRGSRDSTGQPNSPEELEQKQKKKLMQDKLEKSKKDATDLAALAKELREALDKANGALPPSEIVSRAEKIEKLARKIRDEMKAY